MRILKRFGGWLLGIGVGWLTIDADAGDTLRPTVDFSRQVGVIRPLHGVNGGPLCYRGMVDLRDYHRQLRLPSTRLHDVVWVNYDAVDISTIFRDFRDDAAVAENYDFRATDDYLTAVKDVGSPIVYRLGESIEHTMTKYRVHPPADLQKWAEVCCRIIAHYNDGWVHGKHWGIEYWEIWNEPENRPAMWTGTPEEFFELYAVTAREIKRRWPELKVGGPSVGHTGRFRDGAFEPGEFLVRFLDYCGENAVPLDFFSWHRYSGEPSDYAKRARAIRELLDAHGFRQTESHCNEWNYLPREDWMPMMRDGQGEVRERWAAEVQGSKGAAFAAWVLMSLQDAPVDMANFYTAEVQMFGMFNMHGVPQKTYYAFKAFSEMLKTPNRVWSGECREGEVALLAGLSPDGASGTVLLSSFKGQDETVELELQGLPWPGEIGFQLELVDDNHNLTAVRGGRLEAGEHLTLPELQQPAVVLLRLTP